MVQCTARGKLKACLFNSINHSLVTGLKGYGYADAEWGDLLTSFNGVQFTYDAIGNPLSYYNGNNYTMTWENGRRLASVTKGVVTTNYLYNGWLHCNVYPEGKPLYDWVNSFYSFGGNPPIITYL